MSNHIEFLLSVEEYVANNPDVTPFVSDSVARGLGRALEAARKRQAGVEIALSLCLGGKAAKASRLIAHSIKALEGHSHLDWSETIAQMEKAATAQKADPL